MVLWNKYQRCRKKYTLTDTQTKKFYSMPDNILIYKNINPSGERFPPPPPFFINIINYLAKSLF